MIPATTAVKTPPLLDLSVYVDWTCSNPHQLELLPPYICADAHLGKRIERLDRCDPIQLGEEVLGGRVVVERLVVARLVVQAEVRFEHG